MVLNIFVKMPWCSMPMLGILNFETMMLLSNAIEYAVTPRDMTSHHVTLRHTTWHYVTPRDITSKRKKPAQRPGRELTRPVACSSPDESWSVWRNCSLLTRSRWALSLLCPLWTGNLKRCVILIFIRVWCTSGHQTPNVQNFFWYIVQKLVQLPSSSCSRSINT